MYTWSKIFSNPLPKIFTHFFFVSLISVHVFPTIFFFFFLSLGIIDYLFYEKFFNQRSQVYKRRSRDMETETDEDMLQFPPGGSLDASSGSLSSVSLSDKSVSTDNVEEFFGDVPFAGKQQHTLAGCTAWRFSPCYSCVFEFTWNACVRVFFFIIRTMQ